MAARVGTSAKMLRTHPPSYASAAAVDALTFSGTYPVTRLNVGDASLGAKMSVYGYSTLKPTDLKVQNAKAAEAWRKLNAAKVGAEQEAARQQALVDRQRGMVEETLAAEKEAMKAAEPWQARAAEMGNRYAKKRGIVQPAPQEPSFIDKAGQFLRSLPAPAKMRPAGRNTKSDIAS